MAFKKNAVTTKKYGYKPKYKRGAKSTKTSGVVGNVVSMYRPPTPGIVYPSQVKRLISKTEEIKIANVKANGGLQTFSVATPSMPNWNYGVMSPSQSATSISINMGQGVNTQSRIGNRVRTKQLLFKHTLSAAYYNAGSNTAPRPCFVRMMFFKDKQFGCQDLLYSDITGAGADLFENGATNQGYSGTLWDNQLDINLEDYTPCFERTYKIGQAADTGTGNQPGGQYFANNDFQFSISDRIDLTKYCPKDIVYNNNGAVTTPWLFMVIQVVAATGDVLAPGQSLVNIQTELTYRYTDA